MTTPHQLDLLQNIKDHVESLMLVEQQKQQKLDVELTLTMAMDALNRALPYVRHDGPRKQICGAKEQVKRLLGGAA
jgi:hypothetical protein